MHVRFCLAAVLTALPLAHVHAVDAGALDPSFGEAQSGRLLIPFEMGGSNNDYLGAVAVDSEGRIYASGYADDGDSNCMALTRTTPDGEIDQSYGGNGTGRACYAYPDFLGMAAVDAALQTDGKLVAVGEAQVDGGTRLLACRFLVDGAPDEDFGLASTPGCHALEPGENLVGGSARAVVIQADGRIAVAGYVGDIDAGIHRAIVARFDAAGQVDTSFGVGGIKIAAPEINIDSSFFLDLAQSPDGSLVAVGYVLFFDTTQSQSLVVRLTQADGQRDNTFNTDGMFRYDFGLVGDDTGVAYAVQVQPDNSILVAGETQVSPPLQGRTTAIKLLADGSFDETFNADDTPGRRVYDPCVNFPSGCAMSPSDLLATPDGKFVFAGTIGAPNDAASRNLFVVRILADGEPDASFAPANIDYPGMAMVDFSLDADYGARIAMQGEKLVLAGTVTEGSNDDFGIARLGDGSLFSDSFETD